MTKSKVLSQLKNPKLWLTFVLIAVLTWVLGFYWISQPSKQERLNVWLTADFQLQPQITNAVFANLEQYGIKKVNAKSYNPNDAYFPQAFSLQAHSIDIYILTEEFAQSIYETKIFRPLNFAVEGTKYVQFDNQNYGVHFVGDYYIFINSTTKHSDQVLSAAVQTLILEAQQ